MPPTLARIYLEVRPLDAGDRELDALDAALSRAVARAHHAYPTVAISNEPFIRVLAQKAGGAQPLKALEALQVADLYLATACAQGDREAIELLDRQVLARAAKAAAKLDRAAQFEDEVRQRLRERLLVADGRGERRISEYAGRGSLLAWCNVMAHRLALNLKAAPAHEVPFDPALLDPASDATGAETRAARRGASREVSAALQQAIATLPREDRLLLKHRFAEGLRLEEIARRLGTHRTTVARRLEVLREKLVEKTREILGNAADEQTARTGVTDLLQLAREELDLEITDVFHTKG